MEYKTREQQIKKIFDVAELPIYKWVEYYINNEIKQEYKIPDNISVPSDREDKIIYRAKNSNKILVFSLDIVGHDFISPIVNENKKITDMIGSDMMGHLTHLLKYSVEHVSAAVSRAIREQEPNNTYNMENISFEYDDATGTWEPIFRCNEIIAYQLCQHKLGMLIDMKRELNEKPVKTYGDNKDISDLDTKISELTSIFIKQQNIVDSPEILEKIKQSHNFSNSNRIGIRVKFSTIGKYAPKNKIADSVKLMNVGGRSIYDS